ncbi:MAG TPA: 1-acyl-sn-glycerol-3-phosphate acyltransferase [Flavilitoribacter sp.]|nr:1-acyl-sn-glycerol-3-phosphate acyltransferase [Flavilitoribacter sp.]
MLYSIVRPVAALALQINYKRIFLSHADRIPKNKPVILAANHPTAFIEPCVLACFLDRPLYFLVRGDIFKKSFYAKILADLHMIPVYRMKDGGYEKIKNNFESFDHCFRALASDKTLMILAEGSTQQEKRLQSLKKGAARIAFGAFDKYPDLPDLYIVPTGVNYTYPNQVRSEIMIRFGEPIPVRLYLEDYQTNPNKAISKLTDDLRDRMLESVISIDRPQDEQLTEYLLVICRSERTDPLLPPVNRRATGRFECEKRIVDWVNVMPEEEKKALEQSTQAYFQEISQYGLSDRALRRYSPGRHFLLGAGLILGLPVWAVGTLATWPPLALARYVVNNKVRHIEFFEPVRIVIALVSSLIWSLLLLAAGGLLAGWNGVAIAALCVTAGYFAIWYRSWAAGWRESEAYRRTPPIVRRRLAKQRQEIIRQMPNKCG